MKYGGRTTQAALPLAFISALIVAACTTEAPAGGGEQAAQNQDVDDEAPYPTGGSIEIGLGSPADSEQALIVQTIQEELEAELGTSIAYRYITGAGHRIISNHTYEEADNDGYYVQVHAVPVTTAGQVYFDGEYDVREFEPVINLTASDDHIVVLENSEFQTLDDLIAAGREGELQVATTGIGTSNHLAIEMLAAGLGMNVEVIPFDGGGEALAAFIGGHTDFHLIQTHHAQPREDELRFLAHAMDERHERWPDVPTVEELGHDWIPGQGLPLWFGIVAPPGTPQDRVDFLTEAFRNVMADEDVLEQIQTMGLEPYVVEGEEYGALLEESLDSLEGFRGVLEPALAD
jgi:tripartite-type tricarboxylate transporter receptor subunit TctC